MMMNHSSDSEKSDTKHPYPLTSNPATLSLHSLLIEELSALGPMPFDKWMQHCLYHPDFGYYNQGCKKVGRSGDFYTSVSVGSCFGTILAERIAKHAAIYPDIEIVEIGANTGQLAKDILDHLQSNHPEVYAPLLYSICEPLPSMRATQTATLSGHLGKLRHAKSLASLKSTKSSGILLSNELIDAFPVKLLINKEGQWLERCVSLEDNTFTWLDQEIASPSLLRFIDSLQGYPSDYQTEYRPGLESFTQLCARLFVHTLSITIDYGYARSTYYDKARTTGTLRCFHQHTADEAPLELPGEKDITAHVDFTQLARAYSHAGLEPLCFENQAKYLITHAAPLLQKIEDAPEKNDAKWIRQFQTLTHPSMMGSQFYILECESNALPDRKTLDKLEL